MAVRYRNTFYSIAGALWQVDISDSTYVGAVTTFTTGDEGFSLSYKQVSERLDALLSSSVTIPFEVQSYSDELFLNAVMQAQEERFSVKIYKDTVLYWVGVLLPDMVQVNDSSYPYGYNITFTDGLGRLSSIDYNTGGVTPAAYSGRETIIDHLIKLITKTGTAALYDTGDTMICTAVNWYDAHHLYSLSKCPLKYTDLNHAIFYEVDDEGNITYKKSEDVLVMILNTFNATIKMSNGKWNIIQNQEYARPYTFVRYFTKAGAYVSSAYSTFRITPANSVRKTGGVRKYLAPLKLVTKTYKPRLSANNSDSILPIQTVYSPAVDLLNILPGGTTTTIDGSIKERFYLDDPLTGPVDIFSRWKLEFTITPVAGGSTQYLTNKNGYMEWSTTSTDSVKIDGLVCGGLGWDVRWPWSVVTPIMPVDCYGTYKFTFVNLYSMGQVRPIGDDFYNAEYIHFKVYPDLTDELASIDEVKFKATNMATSGNAVSSSLELNIRETLIGDGPQVVHIGKLRANNTISWADSTAWGVHNALPRVNINKLSVDQNLLGQRVPTAKFAATFINNSITALSSVVFGSMVLVPMAISINPASDEVSGEWFNCIIPPV